MTEQMDPAGLAAHAMKIARRAGAVARSHFRGRLGIEFKQDESPVTQADRAVEREVRAYLAQHFPQDGVFGEEYGMEGADKAGLWIVDPIDGTRSFLSGHPMFGFLLAHLNGGKADLGVIGMPMLDEVFLGQPGAGAWLNTEPITVSSQTRLSEAILYINEAEKISLAFPALYGRLVRSGQTRRFSYDCYPHALLAAGHVDAVVDYDLQPYDFMALSAVIEAAGGIVTDWQGNALGLGSDGCVLSAATPALHQALLDLVAKEGRPG